MSSTTALVAAAAICAAVGGASAVALVIAARGAAGRGGRVACRLLAAGVLSGPAGVFGAAVFADGQIAATAAGGAGFVLSMALLIAGTLLLPGLVPTAQARKRRLLDGVILALSAFYVTWTLVEPLHRAYLRHPVPLALSIRCLVVAVPAIMGVAAAGVAVVTTGRASRPRGAALILGGSLVLVAVAGASLVGAVFTRHGAVVLLAAGYAVGCLGLAGAVRSGSRLLVAHPERRWERPGMTVLPLLFIVAATMIRPWYAGPIDALSVAAGAVIAIAVATQQALVRRDMRRYAVQLAQSEAHFREMAHTDALTGLGNRRALLAALESEAVARQSFVLLAIDLDGFKNVNDIRGHDVGDSVLIEVAQRLRGNLRPGDVAARLGGDEFAVVMRAASGEAVTACQRLLRVLSRPYELAGSTLFLSASIGVTACAAGQDCPTMLRDADLALRYAKQRGKNRVQQYDEAYDRWVRRRTVVADALRGACARGEFRLAYQPVVALPEGRVAGVEALLRWQHAELGQVTPDEFIPIAEESGLIDELGAYALHEACRQLSLWLRDGHDIWVSVNVSVRELHREQYVTRVVNALRVYRVPPGRVVLEVTEHAVAQDVDGLVRRLDELRTAGVRVALDDFGSGYSSLGQLRTLPVDILKIDRALIAPPPPPLPPPAQPGPAPSAQPGPASSAQPGPAPSVPVQSARSSAPLVDVLVGLGNRLELDVVAEGITNDAQRSVLEQAQCRYGQGELFGAAMPAERVEALFVRVPVQHPGSVDSAREMRQS